MEKEFKIWYCKNYNEPKNIHDDKSFMFFKEMPFEFQWGVYLKFFDEKGIYLQVGRYYFDKTPVYFTVIEDERVKYEEYSYPSSCGGYKTREQAQKAALEKAKELTKE